MGYEPLTSYSKSERLGGLERIRKLGEIHGDTKVHPSYLHTSLLSMSPVRTDWGIGQVGVFSCNKAADLLPAVSLGAPGVGERAEPQDTGHAGASASQSQMEPGQRG